MSVMATGGSQGPHRRSSQTRRENTKKSDMLDFSSGCHGESQAPHH